MKNLDEILLAAKPGDTINLGPHVYRTRGYRHDGAPNQVALPAGCSLIGTSDTLILCQPTKDSNTTPLHCLGSNKVKHLRIDSVLPAGWRCKMDGLRVESPQSKEGSIMMSTPNQMEFITVSGIFGNRSERREAFGMAVGGPATVENCNVRNVRGDYSTLFLAFGYGVELSDCEADAHNSGENFAALFGLVSASQVVITNATGHGGSSAIYTDTGDVRGLMVDGSVFMGCRRGLHLNAQSEWEKLKRRTIKDVKIVTCTFYLASRWKSAEAVTIDNTWVDYRSDLFPDSRELNLVDGVEVEECDFDVLDGADFGDTVALRPDVIYAANIASQYAGTDPEFGIRGVRLFRNQYSQHPWKSRLKGMRGDVHAITPASWITQ